MRTGGPGRAGGTSEASRAGRADGSAGSRRARREVEVEVELVEDDGSPRDDGGPWGPRYEDLPSADDRPAQRRLPGGARLAAVAAVVLVALVGAATAVEASRDAAEAAALASVPGLSTDLSQPLVPRWEVDGWPAGEVGGLLLVERESGLQARDPETGAVVWERPRVTRADGVGEYCRPLSPAAVASSWWGAPGTGPADASGPLLLGCMSVDQWSSGGLAQAGAVTTIEVVDGVSGEVRATLAMVGALQYLELVEDDVLIGVSQTDGSLTFARWDPATGTQRWMMTSAEPVLELPYAGILSAVLTPTQLTIVGTGTVTVRLSDGQEIEGAQPQDAASDTRTSALPDGGTLVWRYPEVFGAKPGQTGSGEVLDADRTVRFALQGPPWLPTLTDGSAPGVLVTTDVDGSDLSALDAATGDELWTYELPWGSPVLRLRGVLVAESQEVVALDARTGVELWRSPGSEGLFVGPVSDGHRILRVESEGPVTSVVSRDLRTGAEVWREQVPPGVQQVIGLRTGQVLMVTQEGATVYGAPVVDG